MLNPNESNAILSLVFRLFPESQWQPEQIRAMIPMIGRKPIDAEQAEAAIIALSVRHKYKTAKPADILAALDGATAKVSAVVKGDLEKFTRRHIELSKDKHLVDLPHELRTEALMRIDHDLRKAGRPRTSGDGPSKPGELSRIGERVRVAALLAEADWKSALEESPFRYEVKQTPSVKRWLDEQPILNIKEAEFAEVSTNP